MLNGLKPYHYLTHVMEKMKALGPFPEKAALQELLPWSDSLSADCYCDLKKSDPILPQYVLGHLLILSMYEYLPPYFESALFA